MCTNMSSRKSKLLKRYAKTLRLLSQPNVCPVLKTLILKGGCEEKNKAGSFIDCLSEIASNILKGNVPLTPYQQGVLRRHK